MQSKKIDVQCLCEGTGFISQVDSIGDDVELVECAQPPTHCLDSAPYSFLS
jgi:hypothetical protein